MMPTTRSPESATDPWLDLVAAVARTAIADYRKGPDHQHYASARRWLHHSGLLNRLDARDAPTDHADTDDHARRHRHT